MVFEFVKILKMNKTLIILFLFSLINACSIKRNEANSERKQESIVVEAKVRLYHEDETRTYTEYQPFKTRTVDLLKGFERSAKPVEKSRYGGNKYLKTTATGFFHVKKIGDRWWCIDPDGYYYINIALNSLRTGKSERNKKALLERFNSKENWMKETIIMLQDNGFNCAGSWSDTDAIIEANKSLEKPFAYCINWNFMSSYAWSHGKARQLAGHTGYPNEAIFVFDPGFKAYVDERAKQLVKYKDDPNLFGHFSDNEMPFKFESIDNYLALPTSEPGYLAAKEWLNEKGISSGQITAKHREEFMALVADKYFSIVSNAIKKYDPNHMYIGARFYSKEKNYPIFMKTAGRYLDIVSNNYYNHWTPDSADMANWTKWSGRPFIVTEYYTKGEDSGMPNQSGAGWIVKTQKDRGLFYQNYNLALLESKNCVGWHYFKYQDNDPTAKGVDPSNVDANKGIVNNYYEIWDPMMKEMKELNNQVYQLIEYFDAK